SVRIVSTASFLMASLFIFFLSFATFVILLLNDFKFEPLKKIWRIFIKAKVSIFYPRNVM
ncbi:MAG TPA: hypothetical protein PLY31_09245, partial [Tenuifilaceae bacterium]|nr:hypothetical protein [Tenuifilaceae bacterium]